MVLSMPSPPASDAQIFVWVQPKFLTLICNINRIPSCSGLASAFGANGPNSKLSSTPLTGAQVGILGLTLRIRVQGCWTGSGVASDCLLCQEKTLIKMKNDPQAPGTFSPKVRVWVGSLASSREPPYDQQTSRKITPIPLDHPSPPPPLPMKMFWKGRERSGEEGGEEEREERFNKVSLQSGGGVGRKGSIRRGGASLLFRVCWCCCVFLVFVSFVCVFLLLLLVFCDVVQCDMCLGFFFVFCFVICCHASL